MTPIRPTCHSQHVSGLEHQQILYAHSSTSTHLWYVWYGTRVDQVIPALAFFMHELQVVRSRILHISNNRKWCSTKVLPRTPHFHVASVISAHEIVHK